MNYIKHLTGFFDLVVKDERLNPTHISLYISLFQYWNVNRFQNPISISRSEIMRISKISAKATYHKCMKDLHQFGYIRYDPSYNPFRGSLVHLMSFDCPPLEEVDRRRRDGGGKTSSLHRQVPDQQETGSEQAMVPSINNSNIANGLNNREAGSNIKLMQRNDEKKKEKSSAKKERYPPSDEVEQYFKSKGYPVTEAKKFFTHYKAIGWKLSGNPIEDWEALAEKWMINATSFSKSKKQNAAHHLNTSADKNYAEPL